MNNLEHLKDLEAIELETRYEALNAHWEWQAFCEMYGKDSDMTMDALANKCALSDIHKEAYEELDRFKEDIKHG